MHCVCQAVCQHAGSNGSSKLGLAVKVCFVQAEFAVTCDLQLC